MSGTGRQLVRGLAARRLQGAREIYRQPKNQWSRLAREWNQKHWWLGGDMSRDLRAYARTQPTPTPKPKPGPKPPPPPGAGPKAPPTPGPKPPPPPPGAGPKPPPGPGAGPGAPKSPPGPGAGPAVDPGLGPIDPRNGPDVYRTVPTMAPMSMSSQRGYGGSGMYGQSGKVSRAGYWTQFLQGLAARNRNQY